MSFELARKIYDQGFRPTKIIANWRDPIALCIDEFFIYKGFPVDNATIRTKSYVGMEQQKEILIFYLNYVIKILMSTMMFYSQVICPIQGEGR